eukprot:scaffold10130_cov97-Isochrysis_galbana.AAC.6
MPRRRSKPRVLGWASSTGEEARSLAAAVAPTASTTASAVKSSSPPSTRTSSLGLGDVTGATLARAPETDGGGEDTCAAGKPSASSSPTASAARPSLTLEPPPSAQLASCAPAPLVSAACAMQATFSPALSVKFGLASSLASHGVKTRSEMEPRHHRTSNAPRACENCGRGFSHGEAGVGRVGERVGLGHWEGAHHIQACKWAACNISTGEGEG